MSKNVGDLFDRRPTFHQSGRQCMPQRMHAVTALIAQHHMSHSCMLAQNLMQMILIRKRTNRRCMTQEHVPTIAGSRSPMADVVNYSPTYVFQ